MHGWTTPLELLAATAFASFLGSVHCIGMCGPFVTLATANHKSSSNAHSASTLLAFYHVGRLTTYLALGLVAGVAARWMGSTAFLSGSQSWMNLGGLVGATLLAIGIWRAISQATQSSTNVAQPVALFAHSILKWGQSLAKLRRKLGGNSPTLNAYFWGLTTTLLPCGWLYLFVLAALAAPTLPLAVATMAAFWIGTIPLLSAASWIWSWLGERYRVFSGPIATLVILGMGAYLLLSRASLDTSLWAQNNTSASYLQEFSREPKLKSLSTAETQDPSQSTETPMQFLQRMRLELNRGLPCCLPSSHQPQ